LLTQESPEEKRVEDEARPKGGHPLTHSTAQLRDGRERLDFFGSSQNLPTLPL
jgi:hypothetical protein